MNLRYYCGNYMVGIHSKPEKSFWLCFCFEEIPDKAERFTYVLLNTANLWRKKRSTKTCVKKMKRKNV